MKTLELNDKIKEKVVLNEETHTYTLNGKTLVGVTELLDAVKEPFDEDKWAGIVAEREDRKIEDVKKDWDERNKYSQDFGHRIHSYAEAIVKEDPVEATTDEKEKSYRLVVDKYFEEHKNLEPIASELKVCFPAYGVAGTMDLIMRSKENGKTFLYDWKTSKEIKTLHYNKFMLKPFNHIPDANFYHYSLQLNTYAFMIEKKYGVKIDGCYIIHLTNDGYKEFKCPVMREEAELLLLTNVFDLKKDDKEQ